MRIQAYDVHPGTITITVATPRDEADPSTQFTAATIHEDYAARVRALLREYKHIGETALEFASTKRLQSYFPTTGGAPLYALRALQPSGAPREIDADFLLEVIRIRYEFILVDLPAVFTAAEEVAEARERHMESAIRQLFQANSIPDVFIPGDTAQRNPNRSEVDIICEFGPSANRRGFDIPTPV